jgi:alpha/beta superfamily hydrolase
VEPPYPTVVLGGGWCYVKEVVLTHYADRFVEEGVACLAFDYRNLGESDTVDQEQHLDPWKQIEDIRNAITYVSSRDDVSEHQIGVFGISYAGGHSLILSAIEPRIQCAVSTVPVVDGFENMRRVHGEENFYELQEIIEEDWENRANGDSGSIPMSREPGTDWDDGPLEVGTWPFEDVWTTFQDIKENEAPNHKHWNTIASVDHLLNYSVFPYVDRNKNTPVKIVATEGDEKTLWDLQVDAFNAIATDQKEMTVVPDATHMTIYSDKGLLEVAADQGAEWYRKHLIEPFE